MRNAYNRRSVSRNGDSSWNKKLLWVMGSIIIVLFLGMKLFGGSDASNANASTDFIQLTPADSKSLVYISPKWASRKQIHDSEKLFAGDDGAVIEKWSATASLRSTKLDFDENSEFSYTINQDGTNQKNDNIKLSRGRVWTESQSDTLSISLNNLKTKIPSGSIAMLEQTNIINSVVYAVQGDVEIITDVGQYTLKAGEKIVVSPSDIKNAQTKLADNVGPIDATIINTGLFTRNNGEELIRQALAAKNETDDMSGSGINSGTGSSASGSTLSGSTATGAVAGQKYIQFTQPTDGTTVKTDTINIAWTLLSSSVVRVTINDVDASVSPVNENFTMEKFKLNSGVNNIVYKAYNTANVELERWVLVVYGPNVVSKANTIIPENFPNLKDFIITAPATNPYATTEPYVRVQGSIPRNTVQYITVNNFRLTKFVPNSTSWFYHANASIGTIKEGTNLYHIKFYDANDKLIHTQIFTIIKDSKNATQTAPATNDDTPLFAN